MSPLRPWSLLRGSLWNILGATLMLAGVAMVALNAQSTLDFNVATVHHGGQVLDLGHDAVPQAGQHGHMVRVVAIPGVVEAPRDPDFNLSANTPVLTRHVEMFQWREIRIGNRAHYEMDWVDHRLDSSQFDDPRGHTNPAQFPLPAKRFDAGLVQMGGFRLSVALQNALPGAAAVTPDVRTLPTNLAASFSRHGDYLQTSAHADNPQLGDVRVSWDEVPLSTMTVVARLDGDHLVPAPDASDGRGYQLALGDVSLLDLFPDLPTPPSAPVVTLLCGVLLAVLGALVLLAARRRVPAVAVRRLHTPWWSDLLLALGMGVLSTGAVAGVVWAGTDNQYATWWLVMALVGGMLATWQWWQRS